MFVFIERVILGYLADTFLLIVVEGGDSCGMKRAGRDGTKRSVVMARRMPRGKHPPATEINRSNTYCLDKNIKNRYKAKLQNYYENG